MATVSLRGSRWLYSAPTRQSFGQLVTAATQIDPGRFVAGGSVALVQEGDGGWTTAELVPSHSEDGWRAARHPTTGRAYYYHVRTRATTYEPPDGWASHGGGPVAMVLTSSK